MEVPSSKEKKMGGYGEQEERKGEEMGKGFLMRADICGAALSSCLSQTSGCLLRPPCSRPCLDVGGFFNAAPLNKLAAGQHPCCRVLINVCQI